MMPSESDPMNARPLPAKDKLTMCFAHVAYRMGERFALRNAGLDWFEVRVWTSSRRVSRRRTCCFAPGCGGTN